jgi:hypothetical protein
MNNRGTRGRPDPFINPKSCCDNLLGHSENCEFTRMKKQIEALEKELENTYNLIDELLEEDS